MNNSIRVRVANGQQVLSNIKTYLNLPTLTKETTLVYIMLGFPDNLFSISNLYDSGLHCTFTPTEVVAFDPITKVIKLQGWRDAISKLWRFPICEVKPKELKSDQPHFQELTANSAYNLPSTEALIKYHHATAGFLIKESWCEAISNGNYATCSRPNIQIWIDCHQSRRFA